MIGKTFLNYKYEFSLFIISIVLISFFFFSHGNISTDVGREAMIPLAVLNGESLYSSILNIYGPLSYYINACMYSFFGVNLNTLYISGAICSILFIFCFYKICNLVFEKPLSFCMTLFVAVSCMFNSGLYNFIFPYAYAVIYGLTFYFLALYFLMLFTENNEKKSFLFFSLIFSCLSFANKIEFFPAFILTLFVLLYCYKFSYKKIFKIMFLWAALAVMFYLFPVVFGELSISSIREAFFIFLKSSAVPSVKNFALEIGTIFCVKDIVIWIKSVLLLSVYCLFGYFLYKKTDTSFKKIAALFVLTALHYFLQGEIHFSFLAILIFLYLIFRFNKIKTDNKLTILILFSLGAALKTFFNVDMAGYGAYTFPLLFISFVYILKAEFSAKSKFFINNSLIIFLVLSATLSNFILNYQKRNIYSFEVKSEYGKIETAKDWADAASVLLKYVQENSEQNDKILFLPEGALFNFLGNRKTDMQLYALNMPYIETYGSKKIIEMIKYDNFSYIVILKGFGLYGFNNPDYYFEINEITDFLRNNFNMVKYLKDSNENEIIILKQASEKK